MFNGRRQPSRGGTSRMTRECHVRFCEGLGVKFPGPTRQTATSRHHPATSALPPITGIRHGGRHVSKVPEADMRTRRGAAIALGNYAAGKVN